MLSDVRERASVEKLQGEDGRDLFNSIEETRNGAPQEPLPGAGGARNRFKTSWRA